ncbi:MAG: N-acetylmuramoyl-L-alanine amidase [Firmicutes bacterium]|nr:N-acetylmuramoyl-L-alanine amidase [Bacillota bacterium]
MKKRLLIQTGLCIGALLLVTALIPGYGKIAKRVQSVMASDVLVLDPGHGGMDGGAQSSRGVSEKSINLEIAREVKELAEKAGWRVVMTREGDAGLREEEGGTIRSKKTRDLKARRDLIQKTDPELVVSIHLNSFKEDPQVKGVQVFYPKAGGEESVLKKSKQLAKTLQSAVKEHVQDEKDRIPLAKSDVFLFKEVTCPMALIECGFLSNPQEAELLQKSDYQQKLAQGIFEGITVFTGKTPHKDIEIIDSCKQ